MDPVTALALLATELVKFVRVMAEGQTPEQRQKLWDWYIEDIERWRKLLRLDRADT